MTRAITLAHILWLQVIRRKDVYVLAILLVTLLISLVTLDVFGLGGVAAYVLDLGLLMALVFAWLLAIMVSCRQLPQEEGRGTIFALLAKPVARWELIAGKWLGAWSATSVGYLVFLLLVTGVSALKGCRFSVPCLLQVAVLHIMALAVVTAIGLAFSARLNTDAAATLTSILTGVSYLLVPRIPELIAQESGWRAGGLLAIYNVLPHFELFDLRIRLIHGFGPAPTGPFLLLLLYGALLVDLALLLAWVAYRNKRFARGSLSGY